MITIWRAHAERDLDHLIRYIAQFNVKAAIDLDLKIERSVARLAQRPYLGTVIHDGVTRKLVVTQNVKCSGQPIPDTTLSFSSVTAGANPSLN